MQTSPLSTTEVNSALERIAARVKAQCLMEASGHDWLHVQRVYHIAMRLGHEMAADCLVVGIGALLHDVWDHKLGYSDSERSQLATDFLEGEQVVLSADQHANLLALLNSISYKKGNNANAPSTLEAMLVQDADRLDALGAVGIARTFAFGGAHGRVMYAPELDTVSPEHRQDSIGHFYDKLLKLKDLMNTSAAKLEAEKRHAFMEAFLAQFYSEHGE